MCWRGEFDRGKHCMEGNSFFSQSIFFVAVFVFRFLAAGKPQEEFSANSVLVLLMLPLTNQDNKQNKIQRNKDNK